MKLHIGCGKKSLGIDWVHVDVANHSNVDIVCNILNIEDHFKEGTVEEIYACHILEHLGRHQFIKVFESLHKILKKGGIMRFSVPDIGKAMELYIFKGVPLYPTLYGQFWGGQKDAHDYHCCGFDFATATDVLSKIGFLSIERYDWRDFLPEGFDDYSRSYLPHMDFDNGELISLNIKCCK